MKWWSGLLVLSLVAMALLINQLLRKPTSQPGPNPSPIAAGDQEIAWLHNPTSFETWENFVWGVKRAEMASDGGLDGLEVDDSGAFPSRTTAVPEIVIRRKGFPGQLRIRWYKLTDEATQEAWVQTLAKRNPSLLGIIGGWSSDRARELAETMRNTAWSGQKPLLFIPTATADVVYPEDNNASGDQGPSLIGLYDRAFRLCFTNRQMADAVTDYVFSDPTLRPGVVGIPLLLTIGSAGAGGWPMIASVPELEPVRSLPAFAIAWKDDPYSTDLGYKFRDALRRHAGPQSGTPLLNVTLYPVPFSTGRLNIPNRTEAEITDDILESLPPEGERTILVIPTVSAPARRSIRSLVEGNPTIGRRLVAVTGDGISMNTFFRDQEFAWPIRALPVPLVLFTHADPFGWDRPGVGVAPPAGYELAAPRMGAVRSTTEDIRLFNRLARIIARGVFPDGQPDAPRDADAVTKRLHKLEPAFFDPTGNRLSGSGEHVVVVRPNSLIASRNGASNLDAVLEVYTRSPGKPGWVRLHARNILRAGGGTAK